MDDADRAQASEEHQRDAALARRHPALPYTGFCQWCGEITGGGRRFCDIDCREDWQADQARKKRNGNTNP